MQQLIDILKIAGPWATVLLAGYGILNIIGELCELKGKIVPEFMKIRKFFHRKKDEKKLQKELLKNVETLLADVNKHYNADNISKRDDWMTTVNNTIDWVHARADVYDDSILEIKKALENAAEQLVANTAMTIDMFVESSRDRIIDFAEKVSDEEAIVSHEQFKRIFKVHEQYEDFLKAHGRKNGEVTTAFEMIQDAYKYRMKHKSFAEDLKGYKR